MNEDTPRLRPLEAFPVEHEGQRLVALRDPAGYTTSILLLPLPLLEVLALLDGQRSILDIQAELARRHGEIVIVTGINLPLLLDYLHNRDRLAAGALAQRVMIDLSHSNSQKNYMRQIDVGHEVASQIAQGEDRIMGVMVESHLKAGRQDLLPGRELVYGQSITDACIGWEDSVPLLDSLAEAVRKRRLEHEVED